MQSDSGGAGSPHAVRVAKLAAQLADQAVSQLVTATAPQSSAASMPFSVRCVAALVATVPGYLVASWTRNIDGLVEVTGAFGGAAIMFVVPAVLAARARAVRTRLLSACDEAEKGGGRGQLFLRESDKVKYNKRRV